MLLKFYKYHGTGNDFIIIDACTQAVALLANQIASLCQRHFGIGADGLIIIKKSEKADFLMDYYNSDGSGATLCGNGSRCAVQFAFKQEIIKKKTVQFLASDGLHDAKIHNNGNISIKMQDVNKVETHNNFFFCNTGSPHHVEFVDKTKNLAVLELGKKIRNSARYKKNGTNVNFIAIKSNSHLIIRTYERGVEDETFSCGTGAVASTLAFATKFNIPAGNVKLTTLGGELSVSFVNTKGKFSEIWLSGSAKSVFCGEVQVAFEN